MMWLTGRLTPDFKTIADFRKDNGPAIRSACRQFVALCRSLNLFTHAIVAIDGSRFKTVNSRDRSFSRGSIKRRMEQVEASIERYLSALETADRQEGELAEAKSARLKDKIASLREQMREYKALEVAVQAAPDKQISLTDPDARSMATTGKDTGLVGYNVPAVVDTQHHQRRQSLDQLSWRWLPIDCRGAIRRKWRAPPPHHERDRENSSDPGWDPPPELGLVSMRTIDGTYLD